MAFRKITMTWVVGPIEDEDYDTDAMAERHCQTVEESIMNSDMVLDNADCVPTWDVQAMPAEWRPKSE
jgi:hypothetical protein